MPSGARRPLGGGRHPECRRTGCAPLPARTLTCPAVEAGFLLSFRVLEEKGCEGLLGELVRNESLFFSLNMERVKTFPETSGLVRGPQAPTFTAIVKLGLTATSAVLPEEGFCLFVFVGLFLEKHQVVQQKVD